MTIIGIIRVITQDTPLYAKEELTLDGVQTSIQLYYFPVVESSVMITPAPTDPTTVDEDNGVLTFATAPDASVLTIEYKHVNLLDSAIQALIDLECAQSGETESTLDVRLPAADCLDAVASSQALIQKKIKMLDIQTDGPALADALRKHAKSLRDQAYNEDYQDNVFDVVEQVNDSFSYRERIIKEWMRSH